MAKRKPCLRAAERNPSVNSVAMWLGMTIACGMSFPKINEVPPGEPDGEVIRSGSWLRPGSAGQEMWPDHALRQLRLISVVEGKKIVSMPSSGMNEHSR